MNADVLLHVSADVLLHVSADVLLHVSAGLVGVLAILSATLAALPANAKGRIRACEYQPEVKDVAIVRLQEENVLLHKVLNRGGRGL